MLTTMFRRGRYHFDMSPPERRWWPVGMSGCMGGLLFSQMELRSARKAQADFRRRIISQTDHLLMAHATAQVSTRILSRRTAPCSTFAYF